jgi:uncharacterized protein (TIGR02452 family)
MREFRKQVMRETLQALERGWYESASGKRVTLDFAQMEAHARRGRLIHQGAIGPRPMHDAAVEVIEGDCLVHALELAAEGHRPVCLNMASHRHPGGGYLEGAGAQEENLFRRTAYHAFIGEGAPWRPPEIRYPLPEFAGIYSPEVPVLRGPESERYPFLDQPRAMSFVAVAAYFQPPMEGTRLTREIAEKTLRKLRLIFEIALAQGHDAVVLSAIGCGAFRNPPSHMAELFAQVLEEGWGKSFRRVRFAIIDDHNARGEGNLRPFQRVMADGLTR